MLQIFISLIIGYLLGTLSPSALLGKLKNINMREGGSGNLGATNTLLLMGAKFGALVMVLDIAKACIAVRLCGWLFPTQPLAGLLAGCAAVVGHIWPFYMRFKGGKGLAAFGGLILGVDPLLFLFLLILCTVLMFICNFSAAMPMSAAVLFPILYGLRSGSPVYALITAAVSLLIICTHFSNLRKGLRGEDIPIRDYAKNKLFK